jgi:hypothetical protein
VHRRRLVVSGLVVTALLALAGIASHGRPLAGRRGHGPTASFFDYAFTTVLLVGIVAVAVALVALSTLRRRDWQPRPRRRHWLSTLIGMATAVLIALLLLHTGFIQRLRKIERQHPVTAKPQALPTPKAPPPGTRNVRVRWDEIAIVAVLIAGALVLLYAGRSQLRPPRTLRLRAHDEISLALDESLDDLRNDPDLRRAIIAAYARMERALAHAGLPRRPSEAPFEYVERALRALDTSAESAQRLTTLFEWAKFSQHEPGPEMRDEAIAALVAVRDELRAPSPATVPA